MLVAGPGGIGVYKTNTEFTIKNIGGYSKLWLV
jgi:hypothetical protein